MTIVQAPQPLSERQAAILDLISKNGFVTIESLAATFGVSAQTVRRDIITLSGDGRVQRFHGGAGPADVPDLARLDYNAKREIARPEKAIVGAEAAKRLPDRAALFLDVGTTIEACAHELARRDGFTVFTNSMHSAMAFDPKRHSVHVLGGRLAGRDGSLVGEDVVQYLQSLHLDFALIACSAIDETGRAMDFDMSKIAVKRAAMACSKHALLLTTRSKLNRTALGTVAPLDRFDAVVTETGLLEPG